MPTRRNVLAAIVAGLSLTPLGAARAFEPELLLFPNNSDETRFYADDDSRVFDQEAYGSEEPFWKGSLACAEQRCDYFCRPDNCVTLWSHAYKNAKAVCFVHHKLTAEERTTLDARIRRRVPRSYVEQGGITTFDESHATAGIGKGLFIQGVTGGEGGEDNHWVQFLSHDTASPFFIGCHYQTGEFYFRSCLSSHGLFACKGTNEGAFDYHLYLSFMISSLRKTPEIDPSKDGR